MTNGKLEDRRRGLHGDFLAKMRRVRQKLAWTQETLAEQMGVSRAYIADVERGRSCPSLELVERVAAAFGCRAVVRFERPKKKS